MASTKLSPDTINFIKRITRVSNLYKVNQSVIIEKYYGIDAMGMISSHLVSELIKRKLCDISRPKRIKFRSKSSPLRNQILFDCKEPDTKRMRLG